MYTSKKRFKRFKYKFKRIFKGKATPVFRHWSEVKQIKKSLQHVQGIILSGSDYRIKSNKRSTIPEILFKSNIPILGICYGYQYMVSTLGSSYFIQSFKGRKYHRYTKQLSIRKPFHIPTSKTFFYHHDYIFKLPSDWKIVLKYKKIIYMAYNPRKQYIGVQFHPERYIKTGKIFYGNWLKYICNDVRNL
jgi:GMP synthase (glutamine-hydrolysing)